MTSEVISLISIEQNQHFGDLPNKEEEI